MRLYKLDKNLVGKKLGITLKTNKGIRIANSGTEISERLLQKLEQYGFNAIYVEDDSIEVTISETMPEEARLILMEKLNNIYKRINKSDYLNESDLNNLIKEDLLPQLENGPVSLPVGTIAIDDNLAFHSLNVCFLVLETGKNYGFGREKLETLAKAALLHDIGKILSSKYGESHEQKGFEFIKRTTNSVLLYNAVRFHHETIDGEGPEKLEYRYQNDLVKILSLCNYYENLLTQERLLPNECFERIQALTNFKFDSKAFDAFKKSIYVYPTGLMVELSNGIEGVVIEQNSNMPNRPVVIANKVRYNLLEHLSLFIRTVKL